jgi:hypothetical protein
MFRDTRLVATLALGLACGQPDAGGPDTDATGSTAAPATMTAAPTTSGADGGATRAAPGGSTGGRSAR